ncbi:hypothetical protein DFH27DRAFT_182676 [Peziza echinospora]|nr:hypothetical protein DFH27DRAFT_182676 [Peziza echinospora]
MNSRMASFGSYLYFCLFISTHTLYTQIVHSSCPLPSAPPYALSCHSLMHHNVNLWGCLSFFPFFFFPSLFWFWILSHQLCHSGIGRGQRPFACNPLTLELIYLLT